MRTLYSRPHRYVQEYLNNAHIQSLLGVDPAAVNYSWVNMELNGRFDRHSDYWSFQAEHHVAALLERGVRALIYVGATDWICNWVREHFLAHSARGHCGRTATAVLTWIDVAQVGNERMTLGLEWTGQESYRNEHLREWLVDGEVAGKVRAGGGLTFATIDGAGHMVRYLPIGPSSVN